MSEKAATNEQRSLRDDLEDGRLTTDDLLGRIAKLCDFRQSLRATIAEQALALEAWQAAARLLRRRWDGTFKTMMAIREQRVAKQAEIERLEREAEPQLLADAGFRIVKLQATIERQV